MAKLLYIDLRKEVSVLGFEKDKNLINVSGDSVGFGSLQMFRNGVQATGDDVRYILVCIPIVETLQPNVIVKLPTKISDVEICNTPQALALRTYRKKKGLTITELIRRTGIKVHVLERYDIGRTSISYENAKILAEFFDVDLEVFLDDYLKFIYCDGCDEFIKWFKDNKLSTYELTKDRKYRHLKEPLERVLNKDFSKFDRRSYKAIREMLQKHDF